MRSAWEIAKYLVHLANQEPEPELITHMRLQKLLYYVQGWAFAMRGEPLFHEPIEAWRHGPVVRSVYDNLKGFDRRPLPKHYGEDQGLTSDEAGHVESLWSYYKKFSAAELRRKTHTEKPWLEARGDCGDDERCENEISPESMLDYFASLYGEKALPGLSLESMRQSETAFGRGDVVDLDELLGELGTRTTPTKQS